MSLKRCFKARERSDGGPRNHPLTLRRYRFSLMTKLKAQSTDEHPFDGRFDSIFQEWLKEL